MDPGVALVLLTKLDLDIFLPLSRDMLGYSPAQNADRALAPFKDLEFGLVCASAFKDEAAPPHLTAVCPQLNLFHAGFLIAADERDMVDILELAAMPYVRTDTLSRGITAVVISGSLAQWRDAIKLACLAQSRDPCPRGVRAAFNTVYKILVDNGLQRIFNGLQTSDLPDRTFLLEQR